MLAEAARRCMHDNSVVHIRCQLPHSSHANPVANLAPVANLVKRRCTQLHLAASRRDVIHASGASLAAVLGHTSSAVAASPNPSQVYLDAQQPVKDYWDYILRLTRTLIGNDFDAKILFYSKRAMLPTGSPGDPAMDYKSKRDGRCGTFRTESARPYDICPAPGGDPEDLLTRECCRHFAYCVPMSRLAIASIDKVTTVVVAPRIVALDAATWQAMLVHEMGHCIDFHAFGDRYGLWDRPVLDAGVSSALRSIHQEERDPELRADRMANGVLQPLIGAKLCYDPVTTLQRLVPVEQLCNGSGAVGDPTFIAHYSHPPLSGHIPK